MMHAHIAAALVNATWQGALVATFAAGMLRLLGRTSASVRCAIWCAVLAVIAVLPVVDIALTRTIALRRAPSPVAIQQARTVSVAPLRLPARPVRETVRSSRSVSANSMPAVSAAATLTLIERQGAIGLDKAGTILFWLWLAGAVAFGLRLLHGLGALVRLRRGFAPLVGDWLDRVPCRRSLRVAACDRVAIPCLVGFVRPTIVIPRPLVAELADDDLRRIVLHEAAHAQRLDDWANLFVQVVRAALFFNPVVHFIAARIAVEREIACDDRVVELSGDRVVYAACLSAIARNVSLRGAHAVPGFFAGRAQIIVRIEQLLDRAHDGSSQLGRKPAVATAALAIVTVVLARFGIPVVAAQSPAPAIAASMRAPAGHAPSAMHPVSPGRHVVERSVAGTHAQPVVARTVVAQVDLPPLPADRWQTPPRIVRHTAVAHEHKPHAAFNPAPHVDIADAHTDPMPNDATAAEHVAEHATMHAAIMENTAKHVVSETIVSQSTTTSQAVAEAAPTPRPDFLDELSAAGYSGLTVDQLIRLRDHGVTGRYIAAMNAAAGHRLSLDELVVLRDRGVDPAFASGLAAAGVTVSFDKLIVLRDHGVDPAFVAAMQRGGLGNLTAGQLIQLRDHGVDGSFVAALQRAGYVTFTPEQLIRLRDHGVDAAYIAHVRQYFTNRQPTVDELIKMRDGGM